MNSKNISFLAFLIFLLGVSAAYTAGALAVPFHPDESTFFYLSEDINLLFEDPSALFWQPETLTDARQRYRTLDAPLGRYWVGLSRQIAGLPPLAVDWDWGKTWEENRFSGALPSPGLLAAGRVGTALLFPASLALLFFTGRKVGGEITAWAAVLLLASNALILLHTRRAMSEGLVIFTTALTMWSIAHTGKRPWLIGIPVALAFCAKHSLGALAPFGLLAIFWQAQPGTSIAHRLKQAVWYVLLFLGIVILLNPFLWQHPTAAVMDALHNRQDLTQRQTSDRPEQRLDTPAEKLIGMIGSLYLTPPMFAETGNYLEATHAAEEAYLANPLHNLFRSIPAGVILLVLSVFGWLAGAGNAINTRKANGAAARLLTILLLCALFQALALLVTVPLPFQRYYMPLVPHLCLWTAYGLHTLLTVGLRKQPIHQLKENQGPVVE